MFYNSGKLLAQESVFKNVMGDEKNCLGLLKILLEELNLQSAEVTLGRSNAKNTDFNFNQLNVLAKDDKQNIHNIKLNVFNNQQKFDHYMHNRNRATLHPARPVPIKDNYILCICTFDPFGMGQAIYDFNVKPAEKVYDIFDSVHIKVLNSAAK